MHFDNRGDAEAAGPFEARYLPFLETITNLRPGLHRYCSRMTGSVMDGEDILQGALFQAYRKLETFDHWRRGYFGLPTIGVSIFSAAARSGRKQRPLP